MVLCRHENSHTSSSAVTTDHDRASTVRARHPERETRSAGTQMFLVRATSGHTLGVHVNHYSERRRLSGLVVLQSGWALNDPTRFSHAPRFYSRRFFIAVNGVFCYISLAQYARKAEVGYPSTRPRDVGAPTDPKAKYATVAQVVRARH